MHYKLPVLGEHLGRNVTIIRLSSGGLVIHSTGPFTMAGVPTETLHLAPDAWKGELDALELAGKSSAREFVFLHRPSRTLIVTDLLFNVESDAPLGVKMASLFQVGTQHSPGVPRPGRLTVEDEDAFTGPLDTMMGRV